MNEKMTKDHVSLRKQFKAKKPIFKRQDSHKKVRVGSCWRRPKGRQNKMRLHRKGYARSRSTGFGSPRLARGLSRKGLKQYIVFSKQDLESLDSKTDGIIISRTLGTRKKLDIFAFAKEKKLVVLNISEQRLQERVALQKKRKEQRKKALSKRKEDKKPKEASSSDKKKEDADNQERSEQEQKEMEKKEKDKLLTKRTGDQ